MKKTTTKNKPIKPKEILLRLDGVLITPESFKKAVVSFVELLQAVTEEIAQGGEKPLWRMSVRKGSSVLAATPVADVATRKTANQIIGTLNSGFKRLKRGEPTAPGFNGRALGAVRDLSLLRNREEGKLSCLQIEASAGKPVDIVPRNAAFFEKAIGIKTAWGSVEGRLQTISERGKFQFVVFDSLFDKGVNCFIENDLIKTAVDAFGKRVCVTGLIHSDREGRPMSIKADKIRRLRTLEELPEIETFRGILKPVA